MTGADRIVCPSCGSNNMPGQTNCWNCKSPLVNARSGNPHGNTTIPASQKHIQNKFHQQPNYQQASQPQGSGQKTGFNAPLLAGLSGGACCLIAIIGPIVLIGILMVIGLLFGSDNDDMNKKINAWVMAQTFVEKRLKAPSTAKFPSINEDGVNVTPLGNNEYNVFGFVDSQNGFGAMIRTRFFCRLRDDGNGSWRLLDMQLLE